MTEIKFIAETWMQNTSIIITIPHKLSLEKGKLYQFSVDMEPINKNSDSKSVKQEQIGIDGEE